MDPIYSSPCNAEQAGIFMLNSWKYAKIENLHVRTRPPTSDIAVLPFGSVRYVAAIEILDNEDRTWGSADQDGIEAISNVFHSIFEA
jgi:hypothetical protein